MLGALPILFGTVAFLYAMAGFGGGSTYIALLAITGLPLAAIPVVSLTCNLLVSGQGSFLLVKAGHAKWTILAPLLITSIPCAFFGGAWKLPASAFIVLLAAALTLAGLAMIIQGRIEKSNTVPVESPKRWVLLSVGAILGLMAGVTGIGGGIYLAPVMHLFRWAEGRTIAACTSLFIALNSLSGLLGQISKGHDVLGRVPWWIIVGCPIAVIIGGGIGSRILSKKLPQGRIRLLSASVILLVAARLWLKVFVA